MEIMRKNELLNLVYKIFRRVCNKMMKTISHWLFHVRPVYPNRGTRKQLSGFSWHLILGVLIKFVDTLGQQFRLKSDNDGLFTWWPTCIFLGAEVTGWENLRGESPARQAPCNHMGSPGPCHHWRHSQMLNLGQRARIVTLCLHFQTC